MKIAFVSSEAVPYAKTGGLADVAGSLPKALEELGCQVKLFIPKYDSIDEIKFGLHYNWDIGEMPIRVAGHIRSVHLHQCKLPGSNVEVNFIDCPHYFHRRRIYTDDYDEDERFILFSKAVIETLQRLKWAPDIIHCNDWQTALIPLLLKDNYGWDGMFNKTSTILSIHNIGYQGRFSEKTLENAEIKRELYYPGGPVEFNNTVSFIKAGIVYADLISTVSKTYANEILTPEYGAGMENILLMRKNKIYGIINGIDYNEWNPKTDTCIPYNYSTSDLSNKEKNKKFLLERFNMAYKKDTPLIGIISRMVRQKGFDIFAGAIDQLMELDAQWIILGSGEEIYEHLFRSLSSNYPSKAAVYIGFNNELSHLIEAGADMLLMPSYYEPCGLNQIYSLKYGTVPIVRKTGGLADTVQDWDEHNLKQEDAGSGFSFYNYSSNDLAATVKRAVFYYAMHKDTWQKIQLNGMKENFSWENSAKEYITLYNHAVDKKQI